MRLIWIYICIFKFADTDIALHCTHSTFYLDLYLLQLWISTLLNTVLRAFYMHATTSTLTTTSTTCCTEKRKYTENKWRKNNRVAACQTIILIYVHVHTYVRKYIDWYTYIQYNCIHTYICVHKKACCALKARENSQNATQ